MLSLSSLFDNYSPLSSIELLISTLEKLKSAKDPIAMIFKVFRERL